MQFNMDLAFFDKKILTFGMPRIECGSISHSAFRGLCMPKRVLIAATALTVGACSSTTGIYEPGGALPPAPAQWASAPDAVGAAESRDWVAELGDPVLVSLIEEALDGNPSLASSLARLDAARANARISGADRLPSVSGSGGYTRTETDLGGSDSFSLGLSASWEADVWGRVRATAGAGLADADAAFEDLRATQLSIAGLVAKGWYALIAARQQTELAERDVATKQQSLDLTDRRFQRGLARSSDVRTARSALASSEAALASRERAEAAAARNVETLLGRYPTGAIPHDGDFSQLGALGGLGAPGDLLARRPDLRAAARRLDAAGLRADAAQAALLPSLSLTGSTGTGGADLEDLFDPDTLVSSLAASVFAPIFQGGRLRASRDASVANAEAALYNYVSTALTAWREAENAIYADAALNDRVTALNIAFEEAAEAENLVLRQYSRGVATIFDLLNAQGRRISAESQLISARQDRVTNRIDLHLALAGDFQAAASPSAAEQ